MNRQEKELIVQDIKQSFADSSATFVVDYKGLSVSQLTRLRKQLRQKDGIFQVAKLSLVRIALEGTASESLTSLLKNQLAVVFAQKDPSVVAKVLYDSSKELNFSIVGGSYASGVLSAKQVEIFASLPSREVLLTKLCIVLNAPIVRLALVLNMKVIRLLIVLKQIEKQKNSA
jgi:large subunit ribosomal protein L10